MIDRTSHAADHQPPDPGAASASPHRLAALLLGACAAYQLAIGLYFAMLRPPLLAEDLRFLGTASGALTAAAPRLERWLQLVFVVLGGQMAALGVLTAALALRLSRGHAPDRRELALLGGAGALSVGTMSVVNLVLASDFRWLLILPVATWAGAIALAARDAGRLNER